jgi:hypothetical protein
MLENMSNVNIIMFAKADLEETMKTMPDVHIGEAMDVEIWGKAFAKALVCHVYHQISADANRGLGGLYQARWRRHQGRRCLELGQ